MPKSVELEQRLGRVEIAIEALREAVDGLLHRMIAMQAQLDHLAARLGGPDHWDRH